MSETAAQTTADAGRTAEHYCTKCCGPCESIPFHEPDQEMREQCGCSWCNPSAAKEALKFVRQHFDPEATSVPNAKTCLERIDAALKQKSCSQHRASMEILEDVPGETLADRVERVAEWHRVLSDENRKLLSEVSTQVSDNDALAQALETLADAVMADLKEAKRRLDADIPKDAPVHPVSAFLTGMAIHVGNARAALAAAKDTKP